MRRFDFDIYGVAPELPDVSGMTSPVRCRFCRGAYDLTAVEPFARYTDCTLWKAPCCGTTADDRGWKSVPDFVRLDSQGREVRR